MGLTRGMRLAVALASAALPAYLICMKPAESYAPFGDSPFFWPAVVLFALFYAFVLARWLRRRPSPRGPWESSRTKLLLVRAFLALLIATPAAFVSALLYEPALTLANGLVPAGGPSEEYALVVPERGQPARFALDSPYWQPPYQFKLRTRPPGGGVGSLARMKLRRGLLGVRWVEGVEYEALP